MRIAYKNILDDVASTSIKASSEETGYEIENVQDQRLSTKWKSSSATEQSVVFTLDTFPTYPDNVSGQSYFQHFDTATTDSWTIGLAATNMTIFATTSSLVLKASTDTAFSYLGAYRSQAWTTGQTLIIKTLYDADLQSVRYYNGTSYTIMTLVNDNDINYYAEASMVRGSTYSYISAMLFYASTAIAATKTIPIDYVYLGNGKYDYVLEDLSGNGNDGTCYNVVPGQEGLLGNGINGYVNFGNVCRVTGALSLVIKAKLIGTIAQAGLLGKYFTTGNQRSYLLDIFESSYPRFLVSGTGASAIVVQHDVALSDTEFETLICVFIPSTSITIYRGGVQVAQNTTSIPAALYDCTANLELFRSVDRAVYANVIVSNAKIYNRALTEAEITHLYNEESFITENDGLVGKWNVNDGLGVNTAAILGHNLDTATLTAKIQASDNNYWTNPPVDETLTISPTTILKFLSDTYYYKYWRFYFPEGLSALEIGRLWLGDYITIDPSSLTDFKVTKKRSDTVIHGKDRQKWASEGIGWRRIEMNFPPTEETMIMKLTNFYSDVRNHSSFIFMNFDSIREYALVEPIYCSIDGSLGFAHDNRMKFSWSLNIEEEL
jgi:hypothetical protein